MVNALTIDVEKKNESCKKGNELQKQGKQQHQKE